VFAFARWHFASSEREKICHVGQITGILSTWPEPNARAETSVAGFLFAVSKPGPDQPTGRRQCAAGDGLRDRGGTHHFGGRAHGSAWDGRHPASVPFSPLREALVDVAAKEGLFGRRRRAVCWCAGPAFILSQGSPHPHSHDRSQSTPLYGRAVIRA
jgi:hypothetical protein